MAQKIYKCTNKFCHEFGSMFSFTQSEENHVLVYLNVTKPLLNPSEEQSENE